MRARAVRDAEAIAELAAFAANIEASALPPSVLRAAALRIADTVGAVLAGSVAPEVADLRRRIAAGVGPGVLLTAGLPSAPARAAAVANAAAAAVVELDEGARPTGHPAIHILPALLARAQEIGADGQALLAAFVAGYEVQVRLHEATALRRGIHCHGNVGTVAAAAALGRLEEWDGARIALAMNVAAGLAAPTPASLCFEGATARNAAPAMTAQAAFFAHALVESGFHAGEATVADVFGRAIGSRFDAERLTAGLGEALRVGRGYFKFFAACGHVHPVIEAAAAAIGAEVDRSSYPHRLRPLPAPDEIERIVVRVIPPGAELRRLRAAQPLAAKFSLPYTVAAWLVLGEVGPHAFDVEARADERISRLARRVEVRAEPELLAGWPDRHEAEVDVVVGGVARSGACANPFGVAARPPTADDLRAKFVYLAAGVLADADPRPAELWEHLLNIGASRDCRAAFAVA